MNDVVKFDYKGSNVRTVLVNNEPWFVARDICRVFGMQPNGAHDLVKRLDSDESDSIGLIDDMGRQTKMIIVNESGLYKIILRSDKPVAKKFQKWVTSEVLPSLRKTGRYSIEVAKPTAKQLETEIVRLNELFKAYNSSLDKPYCGAILKAAADVALEFANLVSKI